jgi:hypothetical protein
MIGQRIRDHVHGASVRPPAKSFRSFYTLHPPTQTKMASTFTAWLRSPAAREYFFS